jgi:hypothetical protein
VDSLIDLSVKRVGELQYGVAPLWARHGQADIVVAAIALGFARDVPRLPNAAILGVIAGFLLPGAQGGARQSWRPLAVRSRHIAHAYYYALSADIPAAVPRRAGPPTGLIARMPLC